MASCMFVTATLLLTLSFIASGIAFFGPFWMQYMPGDIGLWALCPFTGECAWIWQNDWILSKEADPFQEGWFMATQALYGVGFLLVLATEVYSRCQLCCEGRPGLARSAGLLLIIAFLLMSTGVAVFGGYATKDPYNLSANFSDASRLGWGYWCAVTSCGLTLFTGLLFIFVSGCGCDNKFS